MNTTTTNTSATQYDSKSDGQNEMVYDYWQGILDYWDNVLEDWHTTDFVYRHTEKAATLAPVEEYEVDLDASPNHLDRLLDKVLEHDYYCAPLVIDYGFHCIESDIYGEGAQPEGQSDPSDLDQVA